MHTLRVIKEPGGWTLWLGPGIASPFRTRAQAVRAAECLCEQLRGHGEILEVRIEEEPVAAPHPSDQPLPERLAELLRGAHAEMGSPSR